MWLRRRLWIFLHGYDKCMEYAIMCSWNKCFGMDWSKEDRMRKITIVWCWVINWCGYEWNNRSTSSFWWWRICYMRLCSFLFYGNCIVSEGCFCIAIILQHALQRLPLRRHHARGAQRHVVGDAGCGPRLLHGDGEWNAPSRRTCCSTSPIQYVFVYDCNKRSWLQARTSNFSTVTTVAHVRVCYTIKAYTLKISILSMALVVILMFLPGVVFFWCRTMISRWSWDFSDLSLILLISIGGEAHDRQGRIWGRR